MMGRKMWLPRRLVQFALFFVGGKWLAIGFLRCPFAVPFISCTSCPLAECPGRWLQPFYILGIVLLAFFTGRGFCGWACPMGFVQDALGAARKPRATAPRSTFARFDRLLKWLKWPVLFLVLWLYAHYNLAPSRPYPYVVRSSHYLSLEPLQVAASLGNPAFAIRYVIFAIAIVGALLVVRFWCRYFCPLGAILGLANRLSLFKMGVVSDRCRQCYTCLDACPMATTPSSTDCTWCTDCMNECEHRAIVVGHRLQHLARSPDDRPEEPEEMPVRPGEEQMDLL